MISFHTRLYLLLLIFTLGSVGCQSFGSQIHQGATQKDVESTLGKPKQIHRSWALLNENREIWIYHDKGSLMRNHLYPDTFVIVFSHGKVVATNPPDPYAPLK